MRVVVVMCEKCRRKLYGERSEEERGIRIVEGEGMRCGGEKSEEKRRVFTCHPIRSFLFATFLFCLFT